MDSRAVKLALLVVKVWC